jgi:hypothetical protein
MRTIVYDPSEPVVIRTFGYDYEAEFSRLLLKAADIPALLGVVMGRRGREAASTVNPADIRRLPTRVGSAARIGFVGSCSF